MVRRGDRLFEIIELLRRASGAISAEAIGAELAVTKRTIYRDVAALMAQGVPLQGEAGVGYVLGAGFHTLPLMLTSDEIDAAVLGAQWARTRGEQELVAAVKNLISELEVVAPARLQSSFVKPSVSVVPGDQSPSGSGRGGVRCLPPVQAKL